MSIIELHADDRFVHAYHLLCMHHVVGIGFGELSIRITRREDEVLGIKPGVQALILNIVIVSVVLGERFGR